jgi:hypothetical protein
MSWFRQSRCVLAGFGVLLATTLVAGLTVGGTAAATAAGPAPTWQPTESVSADSFIQSHDVVVDRLGNTTVVWVNDRFVKARRQAPDGTWERTVVLGGVNGANQSLESLRMAAGVDGAGNVTVVWDQLIRDGSFDPVGPFRVMAAYRPIGEPWQPAVRVSELGAAGPALAVAAGGAALVTWSRGGGDGTGTVSARYRPAHADWQPPTIISRLRAGFGGVGALAMNARGDAIAVYGGREFGELRSRRFIPGEGWKRARVVANGNVEIGDVVMNATGRAFALVEAFGRRFHTEVRAVRQSLRGRWTTPVRLSSARPDASAFLSQLVIDGRGTLTASWVRDDSRIKASRRPAGGHWGGPITVYATAPAPPDQLRFGSTDLSVNESGDILLLFQRFHRPFVSGGNALFAAYRPRGGPWGDATRINGDVIFDRGAVHADGSAVAVWNFGRVFARRLSLR